VGVRRDEWIFKHACDFATGIFMSTGELLPMFVGYSEDCAYILPMILGGKTYEEECQKKQEFLAFLKLFFTRHGVDHYLCMHEGWMLRTRDPLARQKWKGSLENHPGRIETLIVQSVTHTRKRVKIWDIEREGKDSVTLVPQDGPNKDSQWGGSFFECLPPEGLKSLQAAELKVLDKLLEMSGFEVARMPIKGMPTEDDEDQESRPSGDSDDARL